MFTSFHNCISEKTSFKILSYPKIDLFIIIIWLNQFIVSVYASVCFNSYRICKEIRIIYSNLLAGRPKAALLFWFFGDF